MSRTTPAARGAVLLVLAAAATAAQAPILASGCAVPLGHDFLWHVALAQDVGAGMLEGDLFPRWIDAPNVGFGLPLVAYPPLTPLLTGACTALTGSLNYGIALALWLMSLGAGLGWYSLARDYAGPAAATLGAVVYVLSPYPIVDLYIRTALAEFGTFVWLPLVLKWGIAIARGDRRPATLAFAGSYAGLLMTHVIGAYLLAVVALPFSLALVRRPARLARLVLAGLGAAVLAAPYLGPLLLERAFLQTELLDVERNYQFLFGTFSPRLNEVLVTQIGLLGWLLVSTRASRQADPARRLLAMGAIALFLLSPHALAFWRSVPGAAYVAYPFRVLSVVAVLSPLALVFAARRGRASFAVALLLSVMAVGISWKNVTEVVGWQQPSAMDIGVGGSQIWVREHLPRAVPHPAVAPSHARRAWFSEGLGRVEAIERGAQRRSVRVDVRTREATLVVRTFHFPGWTATVDGVATAIGPDRRSGAIAIPLSSGPHDIRLRYQGTEVQRRSEQLGLFGGVALIALFLLRRRRFA